MTQIQPHTCYSASQLPSREETQLQSWGVSRVVFKYFPPQLPFFYYLINYIHFIYYYLLVLFDYFIIIIVVVVVTDVIIYLFNCICMIVCLASTLFLHGLSFADRVWHYFLCNKLFIIHKTKYIYANSNHQENNNIWYYNKQCEPKLGVD